jgi:hypothetical protein
MALERGLSLRLIPDLTQWMSVKEPPVWRYGAETQNRYRTGFSNGEQ